MGEGDHISFESIVRAEKPTGEPLRKAVTRIASDELCALHHSRLHIGQQNPPERRQLIHCLLEFLRSDPQRLARDLNHTAVRGATGAEHDGQADEVLPAQGGDLDPGPVADPREHRGGAAFDEIGVCGGQVPLQKNLSGFR